MRRVIAGFTLTFLLLCGALGFFVADIRSRRIAFADESTARVDLDRTAQGWVITLGGTRYRVTASPAWSRAAEAAALLCPPDLYLTLQLIQEAEQAVQP